MTLGYTRIIDKPADPKPGDRYETEITAFQDTERGFAIRVWNGNGWVLVGTRTKPFSEVDGNGYIKEDS